MYLGPGGGERLPCCLVLGEVPRDGDGLRSRRRLGDEMEVSRRLSLADATSGRCTLSRGAARRSDALIERSRRLRRVLSLLEGRVTPLSI